MHMSCPLINSIFKGELLELLDPTIRIGFNLLNISAQSIGIKNQHFPLFMLLHTGISKYQKMADSKRSQGSHHYLQK